MLKRLFDLLKPGTPSPDLSGHPALAGWRTRADMLAQTGSADDIRSLLAERTALALPDDATEIEVERLEARLGVFDLEARLARGELPEIVTQHRAVGGERCCFLSPAVRCTPNADVAGKLFITPQRLRFVGGSGVALKWSAIGSVKTAERDLVVVPVGNGESCRFRCNTFGDAQVAERLINHLRG